MKNILHSIVDVITNSSTEIYTFAADKAVSQAKEALKSVIDVMGLSGDVDSLFDISVKITYSKYNEETEDYDETTDVAHNDRELAKIHQEMGDLYDGARPSSVEILVRSRMTGKEIDLVGLFSSLVEQEAISD